MLELDLHAHVHLNTLYAAVRTPCAHLLPLQQLLHLCLAYLYTCLLFAVSSLLAQGGSRLLMYAPTRWVVCVCSD